MTASRNAVSHEPLVIAAVDVSQSLYVATCKLQLAKCHTARQSEGGCQQGLPFDAGGRGIDLNAVASFTNPQN